MSAIPAFLLFHRAAPAQGVRAEVGDIPAIEGLRGVAILWVLLFHYFVLREGKVDDAFIAAVKSWAPVEAFVRNGYLGVDLFFVITGFLLTLPWFRRAELGLAAPDWRAFYARRARRILPAYYVQLVFLFFVVLPLLRPRIWIESTPFVVGNVGAHATFLHYASAFTSSSMGVNGALWTLAIEFQYYLLLPVIAPLFVRWPWRSLVAAAVVAATWRWLATNELDALVALLQQPVAKAGTTEADIRHLLRTQLPAWSLHFALGVLAGRAWVRQQRAFPSDARAWIAPAIASAAVGGLLFTLLHGTSILGGLGWIVFPLLIAAVVVAVASMPSTWLSGLVASPPLAALGRISYSAYLYHLPLLLLFNAFLPGTEAFPPFVLWLLAVLGVATASYRLVEVPHLLASRAEPCPTPPGHSIHAQ